jgi:hypothetical protein
MWQEENAGKFMLGRHKRVVNPGHGWIANYTTPDEFVDGWAKIKAYAAERNPGEDGRTAAGTAL